MELLVLRSAEDASPEELAAAQAAVCRLESEVADKESPLPLDDAMSSATPFSSAP